MRQAAVAVLGVCLLVVGPLFVFTSLNDRAAEADSHITALPTIRVTELVTLPPLPPVTVTLPGATVTIPGDTVTVPGPTRTVTVAVPRPGGTVTVTEPASTVTVNEDGPTATVTITEPAETVTASPEPAPTVTETASGQVDTDGDTMEPDEGIDFPDFDVTPDTPGEVAVGTLTLLAGVGLILLAMYGGYILGYKDSEKAEAKFLKALLRR